MIRAGALPGRNPGMRTCLAIALYAASRLGFNSSNGTSTASLTRVGPTFSTVLFTTLLAPRGLFRCTSSVGVETRAQGPSSLWVALRGPHVRPGGAGPDLASNGRAGLHRHAKQRRTVAGTPDPHPGSRQASARRFPTAAPAGARRAHAAQYCGRPSGRPRL